MSKLIKGTAGSDGIALAKSYLLKKPIFDIYKKKIKDISKELTLIQNALEKTTQQLQHIVEITKKKLGEEKAEIFNAHIQLANDPEMINEINECIKNEKVNATYAINQIFNKYHDTFAAMEDKYFKERASDINDIKDRLLSNVTNIPLPDVLSINQEVILVAYDLTPSETALLDKKYIKGFVTDIGGRTSHAAIMARTMEIPAVLGLKNITTSVNNGTLIAIDGSSGVVEIEPKNIKEWENKITKFAKDKELIKKYINIKTKTKDNKKVLIEANIGNSNDAKKAQTYGCEGVGLFRTEFLYMDNDHWPTEKEQFEAYKEALKTCKNQMVVIRTLDIGGDKKLSYFDFPEEMNPFLGYRAIRLCLDKINIFKTQIRALLRASAYGQLGIMFPMVATVKEFLAAKKIVDDIAKELKSKKVKLGKYEVGMMVEVPSTAILADEFAKYSDFFSIGTNDLVQYTFACDRMSKDVSYLYQPNNPSLLRLVNLTIQGGHKKKRWVGMCGEMAGDILSIPILLGLGLDAFSMSATSIPKARMIINNLSQKECATLAKKALSLDTMEDVNQLVEKFLKTKKLI